MLTLIENFFKIVCLLIVILSSHKVSAQDKDDGLTRRNTIKYHFISTALYCVAALFIQSVFEKETQREFVKYLLISGVLNILLTPAIFWVADRWLRIWKIERES